MAECGLPLFARAVGGYTFDGAADAARQIMAEREKPDAIFVANDHMAFAVMDVLRSELQLKIPEEISIAGYDDVPEAGWGGYNLTSVRQPGVAMVEAAVAIMLEQVENRVVNPCAQKGLLSIFSMM